MTPQTQPQEEGVEVEQIDATPEQQAQYEALTKAALNAISDTPDKFSAFMESIAAGGERAIQAVAMVVVAMIEAGEAQVGVVQDEDVLESVVEALIAEVYQIAVDEQLLPPEVINEDVFSATYIELLLAWAQANPERLDEEDQATVQEIMAERGGQGGQGGQPAPTAGAPEPAPQGGLISQAGGMQ